MTGARFLLDTNICIYIRRKQPAQVIARFNALKPGEAVLSVITLGELAYGAEKGPSPERARKDLEELAQLLAVESLPPEAGQIYGAIRADLSAKGEIIGANDLWIAAHALAANLTLVTNNEKEFKRVRDLRLQNWIN